jgi:hypothetical protein
MSKKSLISFREFEGKKSKVLTIPKGTILFRYIFGGKEPIKDYIGKYNQEKDIYTLSQDDCTFFYFYPYVRDTNRYLVDEIKSDSAMVTYLTTRDINILLLINPSKFTKYPETKSNAVLSCKDVVSCEGFYGFKNDICFKESFRKENPDIVGNMNLGYKDNLDLKKAIKTGKFDDFKKFVAYFKDQGMNSGAIELALYPRVKNVLKCIQTKLDMSGFDYIVKNLDDFNYFPLFIFPHDLYAKDELYNFLNDAFKSTGYIDPETKKVYHLTIDKRTYFYMLVEATDPEVLKHCLPIEDEHKLKLLRKKHKDLIFEYSYTIL